MAKSWTVDQLRNSLHNAVLNGYDLDNWSAKEIAEDIADYDSDFEDIEPGELAPEIAIWLKERR